jgi:hypothetical protein
MSSPALLEVSDSFQRSFQPKDSRRGAAVVDANIIPHWWHVVVDWSNALGAISLMGAFLEGALIDDVKMPSLLAEHGPTETAKNWLQFMFCTEGFFFAVSGFVMIGIMALTPAEEGGKSRGCFQFAILMAGGIMFGFSGLVFPGCITNFTHVFSKEVCLLPQANGIPHALNAVAHYGVTCFMVGTTIGLTGLLKAPKNKLISPFYGTLMFFLGAWTIGIFKVWVPTLVGGFDFYHGCLPNDTLNACLIQRMELAPANAWTWTWWVAFLGAFFLLCGATIFGLMHGSVGIHRWSHSACSSTLDAV